MLRALSLVPELGQVSRASSLAALRERLAEAAFPPPVLVMVDLHHDDGSALDMLGPMGARWPLARLLVVSALADERSVVEAIRRGAHGYVVKSASVEELARAIRDVMAGDSPITPRVARYLIERLALPAVRAGEVRPQLTTREFEVLKLLGEGLAYVDVGEQLGVSLSTVQTHVRNLYRKLRATSRIEAVNEARRQRLVD